MGYTESGIFSFDLFFFQRKHRHTNQKINIVKFSLLITSCTEKVRKDFRKKKEEVTVSLPYVCRGYKALVHSR